MAPWIMLCLELIIDYIILVFSPHSFPHSLYLYSFFASEKKKNKKFHFCTMGVLYFILKQNHLFFSLPFFPPSYMPTLVPHKKKKKRKVSPHLLLCQVKTPFTQLIISTGAESRQCASVAEVCAVLRNRRISLEDKDIVYREQN